MSSWDLHRLQSLLHLPLISTCASELLYTVGPSWKAAFRSTTRFAWKELSFVPCAFSGGVFFFFPPSLLGLHETRQLFFLLPTSPPFTHCSGRCGPSYSAPSSVRSSDWGASLPLHLELFFWGQFSERSSKNRPNPWAEGFWTGMEKDAVEEDPDRHRVGSVDYPPSSVWGKWQWCFCVGRHLC